MNLKAEHIPRYTYSDYKLWKDDWELIDGFPFSMSPSATGRHQSVVMELTKQIIIQLDAKPCINKCFVYADLDWIISEDTVVRPDIALVCGRKIIDYIREAPFLIVEVISKSSAYRDRIVKKELYEANGVRYYLIADPETKKMEIFELNNGKYKSKKAITGKSTFTLSGDCKIILDFSAIW